MKSDNELDLDMLSEGCPHTGKSKLNIKDFARNVIPNNYDWSLPQSGDVKGDMIFDGYHWRKQADNIMQDCWDLTEQLIKKDIINPIHNPDVPLTPKEINIMWERHRGGK